MLCRRITVILNMILNKTFLLIKNNQILKLGRCTKNLSTDFSHVGSLILKNTNESIIEDFEDSSVILFPGQGTQYVGMAKNLQQFPKARKVFDIANEVLKYDLLKICLEGPRTKLNQTKYAQLAVMVSSLSALEQLREERPQAIEKCVATAGFSLGEISALVFAGSLSFDNALRLVEVRANAMQFACKKEIGGMALVVFSPDTNFNDICCKSEQWCLDQGIEKPFCGIANYLYPHCKVISGNLEALKYLETNAKRFKLRLKHISVSGAFHSPLMNPAVEEFKKALYNTHLVDPTIRVYNNVNGKPYKNAKHIKNLLPKQITHPVKWEQTMHEIYKSSSIYPRTYECGPGESGLIKILKKVNAKAASKAYSIKA